MAKTASKNILPPLDFGPADEPIRPAPAAPTGIKAAVLAAKPFLVKAEHPDFGATVLAAAPKQFASGGDGFFAQSKMTLLVNGEPVKFQIQVTVSRVGSKNG